MTPSPSPTLQAHALVHGDRGAAYGPPAQDFARTAALWTAVLGDKLAPGASITAHDVGLLMAALKLSRLAHGYHADSAVDLAGYAECLAMVHNTEAAAPPEPTAEIMASAAARLGQIRRSQLDTLPTDIQRAVLTLLIAQDDEKLDLGKFPASNSQPEPDSPGSGEQHE
ncbi:MAG TPA: DUF6378 domain-containing protein [Candidatus Xenobia bacterium]|jgi:hypothetical protein